MEHSCKLFLQAFSPWRSLSSYRQYRLAPQIIVSCTASSLPVYQLLLQITLACNGFVSFPCSPSPDVASAIRTIIRPLALLTIPDLLFMTVLHIAVFERTPATPLHISFLRARMRIFLSRGLSCTVFRKNFGICPSPEKLNNSHRVESPG